MNYFLGMSWGHHGSPVVSTQKLTNRRFCRGGPLVFALALLLAGASTSLADTAAIGVTTATGAFDPVAGVPRIVTVSGVASAPERIYVKYRATDGPPCAPSAASDTGTVLSGFYAESVNGSFRLQDVITRDVPGGVLFCVWLSAGDAETLTLPLAQVIAFRSAASEISVTVSPTKPLRGQQATVKVTGSTEAAAAVFASVRAVRDAPCPADYEAQAPQSLIEGASVIGAFSFRVTTAQGNAGRYIVCVWLAHSATDLSSIASQQSVPFLVAAPRIRCVVPSIEGGLRPATVRQRIRKAHCGVGQTLRIHSRTIFKGFVVRLGRRSSTRLPAGTLIDFVISSGPRRPNVHR